MTDKEYTRAELIALNAENAKAQGCPKFWGERCYHCGLDLVGHYGQGYATALITGCPKCCRSYVD